MNLSGMLYRVGIGGYTGLIRLMAPISPKARLFVQGRRELKTHLPARLAGEQRAVVWFHCASLGEFEQGRPLMEAFRKRFPEKAILLTFFSPSGYQVRKDYPGADYVCYLPADTPGQVRWFLDTVRPQIAFFIKYEFWYFLLRELKQRQIPTLLVSGIFRPEQAFFKPWGNFFRQMLACFTHFFVQDERSARLLASVGYLNTSITGDTRTDRVAEIAASAREIPLAAAFAGQAPNVLVAGSTWPEDVAVLKALVPLASRLRFIIAPHEISEKNLRQVEETFAPLPVLRYSQATTELATNTAVLLIDNVGMLSALYQYGNLAYIGGAFKDGLHNILEAAVFGVPVWFGQPHYQKFKEATDLLATGGAFTIRNGQELAESVGHLIANPALRQQAGQIGARYVQSRTGATKTILEYCAGLPPLTASTLTETPTTEYGKGYN